MPDPIRVLHFADSHIGMENYGRTSAATGLNSRVEDFLRRMDEMIAFAEARQVDLTIFAGDAFKTRTPNPTYQREFAVRIRQLSALAPIVLLVGNHDIPPMALKASSIEIYETLAVPNVWVAYDYTTRLIETRRGAVAVGAAPYPVRSRMLELKDTEGKTIAEIDTYLRDLLAQVMLDLAAEADAYGDVPRILTGHFTVDGAVVGSEKQIMLGRDITVPLSVMSDPRWDYVALGHVHRHQNLTKARPGVPPVVYSGSIERIDFGEQDDPKGFCWAELERGAAHWEFHPLAARRFITLSADLRDSDAPTQAIEALINRHDLTEAVVRVRVRLTPTTEGMFDENTVRALLRSAGANMIAAVQKEIEQPERTRLGSSPEGLSDPELLDRYLRTRDVDEQRRAALAEAAAAIFEQTSITLRDG